MAYAFIALGEPDAGVARLSLRREAKKNALNTTMRDELRDALARLAADTATRAVVLSGGDGIFCAGYDLREGLETGGRAFDHHQLEFVTACYTFPKPVIAAVDGPALAGGFDLALMADFLVASTRARFGFPNVEFAPPAVVPLARFVPPHRVRELTLLGEVFDAEQARAWGIVYEVVAPGETEAAATKLAARLAAKPPASLAAVKDVLQHWGSDQTRRALAREYEAAGALLRDPELFQAYVAARLGRGG